MTVKISLTCVWRIVNRIWRLSIFVTGQILYQYANDNAFHTESFDKCVSGTMRIDKMWYSIQQSSLYVIICCCPFADCSLVALLCPAMTFWCINYDYLLVMILSELLFISCFRLWNSNMASNKILLITMESENRDLVIDLPNNNLSCLMQLVL